ncbi:MAG: DegT/DnrJ/EryC1/StrS family aminotransferase [Desulfurivibrionaceae bacterium]
MSTRRSASPDWSLVDLLLSSITFNNRIKLERLLQEKFSFSFVLPTNQGRTAIILAIKALGLKTGDKVALPAIICPRVIKTLLAAQCRPVIMDVEPDMHMKVSEVFDNENDLKCVIVPHLYGMSAPIGEWQAWARLNGIRLIDDAAQSVGVAHNGQWLGTFGDAGILSFGRSKNLSLLRGGAMVTSEEKLVEKAKNYPLPREPVFSVIRRIISGTLNDQFRWTLQKTASLSKHIPINSGSDSKSRTGYIALLSEVFQLTNTEAGLVCLALKRMHNILQERRSAAKALRNSLRQFDYLKPIGPDDAPSRKIPIRVTNRFNLDKILRHLEIYNVNAERIYKPLHLREPFYQYANRSLPVAEFCWQNTLLLPNPVFQSNKSMDSIIYAFEHIPKASST